MQATGEAPFVFKERQLNSILAPALSNKADAFLMEAPVQREWSRIHNQEYNDSHGWVDYWSIYRGYVFLIEIKHNFISYKTGQITNNIKENWRIALEQLDAIEEEAKIRSKECNGVIRVVLHILPIYETVNADEHLDKSEYVRMLDIHKLSLSELERSPNWSAIWKLHDDLVGPYEYIDTKEVYPGILFLCNIYEVSK